MSDLYNRIYEVVKTIPRGKLSTYGMVATQVGNPKLARVVGNALHNNPFPIIVPCHRIVNSSGRLAEGFAFGGQENQRRLLLEEGITFLENGNADLKKHRHIF